LNVAEEVGEDKAVLELAGGFDDLFGVKQKRKEPEKRH
jgi:hypothetical protein